jgi:hypothetical protein
MVKIPLNVLQFATDTSPYEMFVDYWRHYSSFNTKKTAKVGEFSTIRKDGTTISFAEKELEMNAALKREIARVSQVSLDPSIPLEQWASHPAVRWATFAIVSGMIDMILPEVLIESVGLYSEIRNAGFGDSFSFDIKPRDLFVISKSGHGQKQTEVHKQFDTTVTVVPVPHQITVEVALYRVLAGKESLAEFTAKAVKSIEAQMTVDTYNVFAAAMGNLALVGASPNAYMKVAGYSQDALISLAQRVSAWNGGQKVILAGTQRALQYILPNDANYRYDIESEFVKVGYIRTAFGYDTMVLPQLAAWGTPFTVALSDANVYFLCTGVNKPVKLCIEGSTLSNVTAPFDNSNLTQDATFIKNWQAAVATNAIAGLMTVA